MSPKLSQVINLTPLSFPQSPQRTAKLVPRELSRERSVLSIYPLSNEYLQEIIPNSRLATRSNGTPDHTRKGGGCKPRPPVASLKDLFSSMSVSSSDNSIKLILVSEEMLAKLQKNCGYTGLMTENSAATLGERQAKTQSC